ncbi:tagatose 1,6-diphosphate aldolase [Capronia epimyces CBS 606.96]|uniref:Fructose-bisphosphate aldolase n=1 Tax=Capronia epimyces CBS 606.96 TaxID=1182542 RepID=W9YVS0_9EURO|nr:tagatose 1,6-diphosphate aldolase [Capronia epimyces CBS 606.96]EXJ86364.1 tagatose 1,6-diphosphate aldolase [Capronia epimyces CBS 606.96]
MPDLSQNISVRILKAAEAGHYGVPGVVCYNLEAIIACRKAAEAKKSPCQILLFPWAQEYAWDHLVNLASDVCRSASVPMSLHLDHAQSADAIRRAAQTGKFDSIMVDMSHYEKPENLARTAELVRYCHDLGIATEAEPGRINGGEAGVQDTGDLEGILTTPAEALQFIDTGIDFLAPAIGNIHGPYHGVENIKLDFPRLAAIRDAARGKVTLVMHGTNEFTADIFRQCVQVGMTRLNVNQVVLRNYERYAAENAGRTPLTDFMEQGTALIQERIEWMMDAVGSTGRATDVKI